MSHDSIIFALIAILLKVLVLIVPLLICIAFLTLAERKIIGAMQLRKGPNIVGPFGLLQPFADAVKLIFKEVIIPSKADKTLFLMAPLIMFCLSLSGWAVIPITPSFVVADLNIGVLYLLAISSLGVYGIIIAGWASNSRYAFFGSIRSAAQMISYEVSIGFTMITAIIYSGSLRLGDIVEAHSHMPLYMELLLLPMCVIFFISALAETNRHPFDLPEAEAELVGGYNVEYSSIPFALFFLAEYGNMILMSAITTILFLGGWLPPFNIEILKVVPPFVWFAVKIAFCLFVFIWVRAALPRYRYDQLMRLGWKVFLPSTLLWVAIIGAVKVYT